MAPPVGAPRSAPTPRSEVSAVPATTRPRWQFTSSSSPAWLIPDHLYRALSFIANLVARAFALDVPESELAQVHARDKHLV